MIAHDNNTEAEVKTINQIVKAFLLTLPPAFHNGLPPALVKQVGHILEMEYANDYTVTNLKIAYARVQNLTVEAKPEKTPQQLSKVQTDNKSGRVNHAHSNEARELTESGAQQTLMYKLTALQRGGQHTLVKELNSDIKKQMAEGKTFIEILKSVDDAALRVLAHIEIKKLIEGAPGANNQQRESNRQQLATIIREGQNQGMTIQDALRLAKLESDAMQDRSTR